MINISLSDLLNAPETAPVGPTRSGDAAAFTGLLDQIDRHQAEVAAKPARPRAERATTPTRDEEPAKTARSKAPAAPKAKPTAPTTQDTPQSNDDASATQTRSDADAAATRDADANDKTADDATAQAADATAAPTPAPAVVVEQQPAPRLPLALQATQSDDILAGIAAAPADGVVDAAAQTDAAAPVAGALTDKPDQKTKAPAPQMQATDASDVAADATATAQPAQTSSAAATAQATDLSKRLESLQMQIAVRLNSEDAPKPLKAPLALANGMSHPAQTEATAATQTAAAAPAANGPAAPTATSDMLDAQSIAQTPTQTATPAFASLVDAGNDKPAIAADKSAAGETAPVGSVSTAAPASATGATQSAAQAAKPAPLPHPVTEQVAVHIAKASADGSDKINVKLKPASLGQVDVQLDIAADGRVQVVISADRADTLDLLQRDARGLERALNDAGLQMDQQSMSFNLRDQGTPQGSAGNDIAGRMGWQGGADVADEPAAALGGYLNARAAVGGVDIRV